MLPACRYFIPKSLISGVHYTMLKEKGEGTFSLWEDRGSKVLTMFWEMSLVRCACDTWGK